MQIRFSDITIEKILKEKGLSKKLINDIKLKFLIFNSAFMLTSFCQVAPNNIAATNMWGLYGGNGYEICLEYDLSKTCVGELYQVLLNKKPDQSIIQTIEYQETEAFYESLKNFTVNYLVKERWDDHRGFKNMISMLYLKQDSWKYEGEVRFLPLDRSANIVKSLNDIHEEYNKTNGFKKYFLENYTDANFRALDSLFNDINEKYNSTFYDW